MKYVVVNVTFNLMDQQKGILLLIKFINIEINVNFPVPWHICVIVDVKFSWQPPEVIPLGSSVTNKFSVFLSTLYSIFTCITVYSCKFQ